ncbi:trypsin-like peptidase domain-containing protein, partial [Phenylobacterium sp.]|uniref:trypsin-like peptidase domain-containing protein n=1 Tax=Phenylobacterium sp. TaxID=1871053 RepID=UPI00286E2933
MLPTIPEKFDGAIFQILRSSDDVQEICGTGFFVAPGLAISASHVFDGAESGDRFRALSLRNDGSIEWWTVEQFSRGIKRRENPLFGPDEAQQYDVALLSLRPNFEMPSVFDFTFLELEVAVPEEGDLLTVVGYRFPEIEPVGDRAARGV